MNRQIQKYNIQPGQFEVQMSRGASILHAEVQHGIPVMWALVYTDAPKVYRRFLVVGSDEDIAPVPIKYIRTFLMHGGETVWHLFELL